MKKLLIGAVGALFVAIIASMVAVYSKQLQTQPELTVSRVDIQEKPPQAKKSGVPPGELREYYKTYDYGDIQYDLSILNYNKSGDQDLGNHVIRVKYYNTKNKVYTPSAADVDAITINCVNATNESTKQHLYSLKPFEDASINLEVNAGCKYLGTADKKFYWKIEL